MRFRRGFQAVSVAVLGCVAPLGAADESAVRDFIRLAEERFAAAQIRGDVATMMEIYADDAVVFPPGEGPVAGKEAVRRWRTRGVALAPRIAREQFETASLEVCGDLAVETGSVSVQEESRQASAVTTRTPYITVWKRQEDGSWKIQKDMWNPGPRSRGSVSEPPLPSQGTALAAPLPPPVAAAAVSPPPMPAPPPDFIPIPDARPLSDGFVRNIGDQLRARAGKIRSLEASNAGEAAREAAIRRADRELQTLIRDVGWIDVGRFGVETACNAAFIVEKSGDPTLIKTAVPQMKDLQSNEESVACYRRALAAYEKLPK